MAGPMPAALPVFQPEETTPCPTNVNLKPATKSSVSASHRAAPIDIEWGQVMDKLLTSRFAVLSSDLVVPRLEDMERDFINAWVRMKGNLLSGGAGKLGFRQEKRAKDLAADAHSRRLRQVGLSALAKEARAQVIALARAGAALSGPSTRDEVYQFAADLHAESPWMRDVSTLLNVIEN